MFAADGRLSPPGRWYAGLVAGATACFLLYAGTRPGAAAMQLLAGGLILACWPWRRQSSRLGSLVQASLLPAWLSAWLDFPEAAFVTLFAPMLALSLLLSDDRLRYAASATPRADGALLGGSLAAGAGLSLLLGASGLQVGLAAWLTFLLVLGWRCLSVQTLPTAYLLEALHATGLKFSGLPDIAPLADIDTLIFDLDDLPLGAPQLVLCLSLGDATESRWLSWCAELFARAARPEAEALNAERDGELVARETGHALRLRGECGEHELKLGHHLWFRQLGYDLEPWRQRIDLARTEGLSLWFVAVDGQLTGILGFRPTLPDNLASTLRQLQADGLNPLLLTQEHETTALAWGQALGLEQVVSLATGQYRTELDSLQRLGHRIASLGVAAEHPAVSLSIGWQKPVNPQTGPAIALEQLAQLPAHRRRLQQARRALQVQEQLVLLLSLPAAALLVLGLYPASAGLSGLAQLLLWINARRCRS